MTETPCVAENHLRGRYNEVAWALHHGSPHERYEAAVKLAGIALRYAWENRVRPSRGAAPTEPAE